jgi:hypothetical protein
MLSEAHICIYVYMIVIFMVFILAEETAKCCRDSQKQAQDMKIEMLEKLLSDVLSKFDTLDKKVDHIVDGFKLMTTAPTDKERKSIKTENAVTEGPKQTETSN